MTAFRLPLVALLAVLCASLWHQQALADQKPNSTEKECESHGTSVLFAA